MEPLESMLDSVRLTFPVLWQKTLPGRLSSVIYVEWQTLVAVPIFKKWFQLQEGMSTKTAPQHPKPQVFQGGSHLPPDMLLQSCLITLADSVPKLRAPFPWPTVLSSRECVLVGLRTALKSYCHCPTVPYCFTLPSMRPQMVCQNNFGAIVRLRHCQTPIRQFLSQWPLEPLTVWPAGSSPSSFFRNPNLHVASPLFLLALPGC